MKTIVAYQTNILLWHLYNNCGLQENAVNGVVNTINDLNAGRISLESQIAPNADCTVEEMLVDLKIDYES